MRILFCDIEASNGSDICSFGYVLTDENLCVIKKEDILIRPFRPISNAVSKLLAYPKEIFDTAPPFDQLYQDIFALLQGADFIVGHSFSNDIKFLHIACDECKITLPSLAYFDTQILYSLLGHNGTKRCGLESIANALQISFDSVTLHRADDDAYLTMKIFEKLCEQQQLTPVQLLQQNTKAFGKFICGTNYEYTEDMLKLTKSNLRRYEPKECATKNIKIEGKRIGFCNAYLQGKTAKIWTLCEQIVDCGGMVEFGTDLLDVYVFDGDTSDKAYKKQKEKSKKCKYPSLAEFCEWLGIEDFDSLLDHPTDHYCPIGKLDLSHKQIDRYAKDRPENNVFASLLSKLGTQTE